MVGGNFASNGRVKQAWRLFSSYHIQRDVLTLPCILYFEIQTSWCTYWHLDHKGTRFCSRKELCRTTLQVVLRVENARANIPIASSHFELLRVVLLLYCWCWCLKAGTTMAETCGMHSDDWQKRGKKMPSDMQNTYWRNGRRGSQLMTLSLREIWRAFWRLTPNQ